MIFKATSFADLLGRMDFINEVMEYDRNVMEQLRATREQLAMDQEALEEQKAELISTQQEMEEQIAAAEALIKEYESTEAGMQAMHEQAEEDEARILELIKKANSQNSGSSGGSSGNAGVGGYIWPTNSTRYVTSPYGYRICPFHGKEYHNGADIGAPYGSPVLAPKSGTVIQAGWNGGYGISVMIDHHDGIVTLFGHMCDRNVSEGQQVVQGQVIGWCGSTGNSDGPHIHYTMYKNGAAIDPLPYLPGYIAYDW